MKYLKTFENLLDKMIGISDEEIKKLIGPERYTLFNKYNNILTDKSPEYVIGYINDIIRTQHMKNVLTTDIVTCNNEKEFNDALSDIPKSDDVILTYSSHLVWYEDSKPVKIIIGKLNDGNEWKYYTKYGIANFFYNYINKVYEDRYRLHTISYTPLYLSGYAGTIRDSFRIDIISNNPNEYSNYGWYMTIDKNDNKKFKEYMENVLYIPYK